MKQCKNCFEQYEEEYGICPHCGYGEGDPADPAWCLPPGSMLAAGRYLVGMTLGTGGFGITYKVWDTKYHTVKAVKEYYPSGLANRMPGHRKVIHLQGKRGAEFEYGLRRFLFEARNMARFSSETIIRVYDFFEGNDTGYIVMEYLEGESLGAYVKEKGGRISWEEAAAYGEAVCQALGEIHGQHYIHRDISPENIFRCSDGRIKLIDFGAAKFEQEEDGRRVIILKPGFAPPEQYEQITAQGPWTDIYALGATLYFLITGVRPPESVNRSVEDTLEPPAALMEELPETVSNAIVKAMALEPTMRFQNVKEFQNALTGSKPVLSLDRERRRRSRKRAVGIAGLFCCIAIAALGCVYVWNQRKKEETIPAETELLVWYEQSEDTTAAEIRAGAMAELAARFEESYPNVDVKLQSFVADSYREILLRAREAGNMPGLYESSGMEDLALEDGLALGDSLDLGNLFFQDQIAGRFPQGTIVPAGFSVPVLYRNTALGTMEGDVLNDPGEMTGGGADGNPVCVIEKDMLSAFEQLYGDPGQFQGVTVSDQALEEFLSGKAAYCFSDILDYHAVQQGMPAMYQVIAPGRETIPAQFCELWSVSSQADAAEQKAAEKFLEFLLSDNGEDILYVQNSRKRPLPINKNAAEAYLSAYEEILPLLEHPEKYSFEKY